MEVRVVVHRHCPLALRRTDVPPVFSRPRNPQVGHGNLRADGLGLDDERWGIVNAWLEARERLSEIALGTLLRTHDALPAGHRCEAASDSGRGVGCLGTSPV